MPFPDLLEELFELVAEDAAYFGCRAEIASARDILRRGTSAHRQLAAYQSALALGASASEALQVVVDMLIEETVQGL